MSLLGLASPGRKSKFGHARNFNPSSGNRYVRANAGRLVYESLESRQLLAGLPEMIELAFDSYSISQITSVGTDTYFVASTQDKGQKLWKVDSGSVTGATIVKDILPGSSSSNPHSLTNVNGTLFFSAYDGVNGIELWSSNGTAAGTRQSTSENFVSSASSSPSQFTEVNGVTFFLASTPQFGSELWKSDGTLAGTSIVKDIQVATVAPFRSI